MAEATNKVLEGVFAIDKPPHLSSAQVLRDLQGCFEHSKTFAPLLRRSRDQEAEQEKHQPKRRRRRGDDNVFKMGHGGTLDPMATGVLIVGIGKGTKHLNSFLGCTKTYETVVLFGKTTDTYDVAGRVVAEAPYEHVTKELVERQLKNFRGKIKQIPPIYSALKINGMKAYEYARSGKELPRELESRNMEVTECEMLEWYEGGQHPYRWPAEEAVEEDKSAAMRVMGTSPSATSGQPAVTADPAPSIKPEMTQFPASDSQPDPPAVPPPANTSLPLKRDSSSIPTKSSLHTHALPQSANNPSPSPACRVRLSVSSGFYVRSFAHDLGNACSSFGIMASLVRSRQADFWIPAIPQSHSGDVPATSDADGQPLDLNTIQALPYADLALGEQVWGPKIRGMIEQWGKAHPDLVIEGMVGAQERQRANQWGRDREGSDRTFYSARRSGGESRHHDTGYSQGHTHSNSYEQKRRRNSSSPEA